MPAVKATLPLIAFALASAFSSSKATADSQLTESSTVLEQPGGQMTMKRLSSRSYIFPGNNLSAKRRLDFWTGFSLFRDPWVIAPSSTKDRDGLGPLFNARSCVACHKGGSRGKMSSAGESLPTSLLIRLGPVDRTPDAASKKYGGQIQPRSIKFNHGRLAQNPEGEAWLDLRYDVIDGKYPDGTSYQLHAPSYQLTKLKYGAIEEGISTSPRFTPNIFGAGLLDAISTSDLLLQEDPADTNRDGISARYNRVVDRDTGEIGIGRFGFKAIHPTLKQQVAAAFIGDIGITSSLFPSETCTETQVACIEASKLGGHKGTEIPDKLLKLVVNFNAYLGVPPVRINNGEILAKGKAIFSEIGCASCHTPSYTTDKHYPIAALANQKIWPYTDLALHDMGPALSDGVVEGKATGREWRTPPLWGIGLQQEILGESRFLHDGRARSIEEAILWHGGEALQSQQKFKQLNAQERKALLTFLASI